MELTWRWFGTEDIIKLSMLREIGVQGIVSALHQIKNGEVWPIPEIQKLKQYIEDSGLQWSVVESLPVSESIKYGGHDRDRLIENYKVSLANLGKCGIHTVCYNFMPVLDWARTDLCHPNADGIRSLYFDKAEFALFDQYILHRDGAENDYDQATNLRAKQLYKTLTDESRHKLVDSIIVKTQCFVNGNISKDDKEPVAVFKKLLDLYKGIDRARLRENLHYFLSAIMPVCDEYDMNMCIHPDDPPMQLLGLPRIVTSAEDIDWILNSVDNKHNGLTFCAGSLSAGPHNDIPSMAKHFASRTHFVHLRSTQVEPNGNFQEASHLGGRAHITELVRIFESQNPLLPMRVDHGPLILNDEKQGYNAGYSFHGRMLALGQIQGILAVIDEELGKKDILDSKNYRHLITIG